MLRSPMAAKPRSLIELETALENGKSLPCTSLLLGEHCVGIFLNEGSYHRSWHASAPVERDQEGQKGILLL